jgi:SAM-dependent methyltransferase
VIRFSEQSLEAARRAAHPAAEYIEQESFVRAGEIRALAGHAGIAAGTSVLDLCCGIAGPGRFLVRELGCRYVGVDAGAEAIEVARERARGLDCRFEVARVPPLPAGRFDVVLLLETMLAFSDKQTLVEQIAGALDAGGRFAFTLEEGRPLTAWEREVMPNADTVCLTPLQTMRSVLDEAGLVLRWQ